MSSYFLLLILEKPNVRTDRHLCAQKTKTGRTITPSIAPRSRLQKVKISGVFKLGKERKAGRAEGGLCRVGERTGRLEIEKRGSPLIFGRSGALTKRDGEEDCKQDMLPIPNRSRAAGERKVKSTEPRGDGENH